MAGMSLTKKIAIAGITGKLGILIAEYLLSNDFVEVHGIARNPDKVPEKLKSNPKLKLFKCDLTDSESLKPAVQGCSITICSITPDVQTEITIQKALIDASVAQGVPRYMANEFTIDWRCADLDLLPQKKGNQVIYEYLDKYEDKIQGVHILIGGFMETIFSAGFLWDLQKGPAAGVSTWGTGEEIWELTSYDNAAQWTAQVALDKEAIGFFKFLGDRLSIMEIAKTLEEAYNLPPIPFTSKGSLADLKSDVARRIKEKGDSMNYEDWMAHSYQLFMINGQAYLEIPLDNGRYIDTVEQESLEYWLDGKKLEDISKTWQF